MAMKTKIFVSTSTNPWFNLAFEEYLVETVEKEEVVFYLWQNQHTVVIGKHQNPWREVLVSELEADAGKLARRLSGGGAVYHDLGNLNFTFVMHKSREDLHRQLGVILNAVKSLGIEAEFSGRNDIVSEGRKFSGNAFYYGKNNYYHHGTVLVDVDMSKLGKYLNVSMKKLSSKGVQSVKSRVVNLKELQPELTILVVKEALIESFKKEYGESNAIYKITEHDAPEEAIKRFEHYASWEWRFGKTPAFDASFEEKFEWGEVVLNISSKAGRIVDYAVYSDAMSTAFIELLQSVFTDVKFERVAMVKALEGLAVEENDLEKKNDLIQWMTQLF